MTPTDPTTVQFMNLTPDEQRLQIRDEVHALGSRFIVHCKDPGAHRDGNRLKGELRDKGPVVAVLGALILLLEALGIT